MTSRRDGRDSDRRRPVRDDLPTSSRGGRGPELNEFFVDGKGIHREVLQREICKYLGPEAFSRPSTYNGVSGYTITAVRPFTSKMLDDLQELSRSYEAENRQAIRRGHTDIPYVDSRTHQKATLGQISDDPYNQDSYQTRTSYTMPSAQPGYMAPSRPEYPPTQASAYPGSLYPQGTGYGQGSTYPPGPAYPSAPRPGVLDAYNAPYDPYADESSRPSYPAGTRRDTRIDPRDQRVDLRGAEPRGYPIPEARNDPRDIRDTRVESRMMPGYSYSVNSPPDVSMHGYEEYPSAPMPTGRGSGPYGPSRMVQTGYDSRESPQLRDAYRHEPIREERRPRR